MKKILFLTSNSLATNPRLVKELKLAVKHFDCTVYAFKLSNWSDYMDAEIKASFPEVTFRELTAGRKPLLRWFCNSILEKFAQTVYPIFTGSLLVNTLAHSKRNMMLHLALKKERVKYDLVVAHNLAALYPAFRYTEANHIPYGFDLEDYHPGEAIKTDAKNEIARRKYLLASLLPKAMYVSYASPLIGDALLALFKGNFKVNHFLVNNSFFSEDFVNVSQPTGTKLSFVWFSQHISTGRGLELVIPVLYKYRDRLHVTLIGNLDQVFYKNFLKAYEDVVSIKAPMKQKELHEVLSTFDIGLAIELSATDLNRDLCLTNKIFAYSQAGLYLLVTNTRAQQLFVEQYPLLGEVVEQTPEGIENAVRSVLTRLGEIRQERERRIATSKELAWEYEAQKLLAAWNV